jgi:hypothetical protein
MVRGYEGKIMIKEEERSWEMGELKTWRNS